MKREYSKTNKDDDSINGIMYFEFEMNRLGKKTSLG